MRRLESGKVNSTTNHKPESSESCANFSVSLHLLRLPTCSKQLLSTHIGRRILSSEISNVEVPNETASQFSAKTRCDPQSFLDATHSLRDLPFPSTSPTFSDDGSPDYSFKFLKLSSEQVSRFSRSAAIMPRKSFAQRRRQLSRPQPRLPKARTLSEAKSQKQGCHEMISSIMNDNDSLNFRRPVSELWPPSQLLGYSDLVKKPMDLGTITRKLANNMYSADDTDLFDLNLFRDDLRMVFLNALQYNRERSIIAQDAMGFLKTIDAYFSTVIMRAKHQQQSSATGPTEALVSPSLSDMGSHSRGQRLEAAGMVNTPSTQEPDTRSFLGKRPKNPSLAQAHGLDDSHRDPKDDVEARDLHDEDLITPAPRRGCNESRNVQNGHLRNGQLNAEGKKPYEKVLEPAASASQETNTKPKRSRKDLVAQLANLRRLQCQSRITIDQLLNEEFTDQESCRLRDSIEGLPWEEHNKVVELLQAPIQEAVERSGEEDPIRVSIDVRHISTQKKRNIEALINPNSKLSVEREKIVRLDEKIASVERKLSALND